MISNNTYIYIKLTSEDIDVYRPVKAVMLDKNIFKIIDYNIEQNYEYGERWEFNFGDIIECNLVEDSLYAVKLLNNTTLL